MMKRFLAACLTAAMVVGMVVGCGSSSDDKGGSGDDSSAAAVKVIDIDLTEEEYAFGVDKTQPEL